MGSSQDVKPHVRHGGREQSRAMHRGHVASFGSRLRFVLVAVCFLLVDCTVSFVMSFAARFCGLVSYSITCSASSSGVGAVGVRGPLSHVWFGLARATLCIISIIVGWRVG